MVRHKHEKPNLVACCGTCHYCVSYISEKSTSECLAHEIKVHYMEKVCWQYRQDDARIRRIEGGMKRYGRGKTNE